MKKSLLVAGLVALMGLGACSDGVKESDVPATVKSSFQAKYPGATDAKWKKETSDGKKVYEAEFKLDGKEIEAEFLEDGTFHKED